MRLNPFDLAGPEFLLFYAALVVALAAIAWLTRVAVASGGDAGPPDPTLDAYELACLAGGRSRVVLLAVASLVDRGHARLNGRSLSYRDRPLAQTLHPIERELIAREPGSTFAARHTLGNSIDAIEATLRGEGLTAGREAAWLARFAAVAALLVAIGVGAIKAVVGASRHRPILFLMMGIGLSVMAILPAVLLPPPLTARGRRLVAAMRRGRPRSRAEKARPVLADAEDAAFVALYGLPALIAHPAYQDLRGGFESSSSSGGDGGSSCSSSSCGSSCGGGGGGCGGCSS